MRRYPLAASTLRPAVFLDRDGTVTGEGGYLNHASPYKLLSGTGQPIRRLNESGLTLVGVTNQSGVGRGYFREHVVREMHEKMSVDLRCESARLDGVYYCPHVVADPSNCRQPKIGMLKDAASGLELRISFVVADRHGHIAIGHRAGARIVLATTGYGERELAWHVNEWRQQTDFVAVDLAEAVD